jgi:lysophospholipase L1-like esterase
MIGDSISMGYTPTVVNHLSDVAEVMHNPGNGGDSANVLACLDDWLAEAQPDVVVLNCGLHDLKRARDTKEHQVPLDAYRANLEAILTRLRPADCHVVWVTITPVIDARHQAMKPFDRHNVDVEEYNEMARAVMDENEVAVIDLERAAKDLGLEDGLTEDGVHFTHEAYVRLGEFVTDRLREHPIWD